MRNFWELNISLFCLSYYVTRGVVPSIKNILQGVIMAKKKKKAAKRKKAAPKKRRAAPKKKRAAPKKKKKAAKRRKR